MICPICKSSNTEIFLDYGQYPYFTVPVDKKDKKKILTKYSEDQLFSDLKYEACKDCGHVSILNIPDQETMDDLYSNFYSYPSPMKDEFEPTRDRDFINYFKRFIDPITKENNLSKLLEIGCFDGFVLQNLSQINYDVIGCDPSDGADIGKDFGINILKEFFEPKLFINNNITFDIVLSRHLIEHMVEPENFLSNIRSILNPNGMLIIETPNVHQYMRDGRLGVFSLQHITLFSASSLKILLGKCGFKKMKFIDQGDNLIIIATKGWESSIDSFEGYAKVIQSFHNLVKNNKKKIYNKIEAYLNKNKTICIWGAGGAGIAALTLYGIPGNEISYFIDSDKNKWGMEYFNYSIPIISPKKAAEINPDLLIISSMYHKSIIDTAKEIGLNKKCIVLN